MKNPKDINWFAAPPWANWHVINANGKGWFYDKEPIFHPDSNFFGQMEMGFKKQKSGYYNMTQIHWATTKEKRPDDITLKSFDKFRWNTAPEWANYFVCDLLYGIRGIGFFADTEPVIGPNDSWLFTGKVHQYAGQFDIGKKSWRETLTKRPK
jgi:hypothetical protein